jgi:hypothetical protein
MMLVISGDAIFVTFFQRNMYQQEYICMRNNGNAMHTFM